MLDLFNALTPSFGAKWIKADLHLHTPGSYDFRWKGLDQSSFTADDYISALQDMEVNLAAVTDHSTEQWIDRMIEAAERVHVVVLFPEDRRQGDVSDFLSKIEIDPPLRNLPDTSITENTLHEVASIAHAKGGILIGAHCLESTSGIVAGATGQTRIKNLKCLDAVEIRPGENCIGLRSKLKILGVPNMPVLVSSDAHSPIQLSPDVTWIKMSGASFRGLYQIKYEPISRVSHTRLPAIAHPHIVGFKLDGGLLADVHMSFSEHLNLIIGGRGSGKSAVLDTVRFGLGMDARIDENRQILNLRMTTFIGNGSTVSIYFRDSEGRLYCATRRGDFTEKKSHPRPIVTFPPRQFSTNS